MRRFLWAGLFGLMLVMPFVLRLAVGAGTRATPDRSARRLIVITPHSEAIRSEFAQAFSNWHAETYGSPVFVDYRIYGGASDILRYFDSARRTLFTSLRTYKIDVVGGGGDDLFENRLRKAGYLQGVQLPGEVMSRAFAQREINGVPLYDQSSDSPTWFGTALSSFGIVYNRDVLRHLGLPEPKTWSDLRDPRYANWIVLADPTRSRVAQTAFMLIVERAMQDAVDVGQSADEGWARGMGLIRLISGNARMFSDSGTAVPGIVGSGDAAAGMAIDFQARAQVDAVQMSGESRLGYVEPAGATGIFPDPVAMVQGAENRQTAERFIEFLLSEPGQRLWNTRAGAPGGPRQTSMRRLPIMKSVYDSPADFTDRVNPYQASGSFNTRADRTATSGIISELIDFSCIELLDDLKETRRIIAASKRADELDAQLGLFPFDQREALARAKRWRESMALERIEMQRSWTQEFRDEYARLREAATK